MGKLSDKVAIVTGSTEGIGLAIAEKLAQDGARVVISSRTQKNVDAIVQTLSGRGLQVTGCVCHVGKPEDRTNLIQTAVDKYGGLDIVVCNAGVSTAIGPIFQTTESAYDEIMDTNVKATFFLCKEAYPFLQKRGGGSIVLVSSVAAYTPNPIVGIYCTSKTAMLGLTKAMAPQLAESNIRINGIAPGLIKTKMNRILWENEEAEARSIAQWHIQRMARPEECAGAVSFLVSDEASYITGETLVIAGGAHSHL